MKRLSHRLASAMLALGLLAGPAGATVVVNAALSAPSDGSNPDPIAVAVQDVPASTATPPPAKVGAEAPVNADAAIVAEPPSPLLLLAAAFGIVLLRKYGARARPGAHDPSR